MLLFMFILFVEKLFIVFWLQR